MTKTLYIDGQWLAAHSEETRNIHCPADGSFVGTVATGDVQDANAAIDAAKRAFDSRVWFDASGDERGDFLDRVAHALEERLDDFAKAEALDTGKRFVEAQIDIKDVIACFKYFARAARGDAGRVIDAGNPAVLSRVVYEPVGVCALITPWNFPLLQAAWKVAPCLAAGNSLILKPAEITPHTAVLLFEIFDELGLPAGVANLVLGAGSTVGARMSEHPDVDLVSFTGGLPTGQRIAAAAAKTVKKLALELGGKNPNVIFADADFDAALDNALNAGFMDSGQVCSAGTRLIIEESIAEKFVNELVERAQRIRMGGPFDPNAETGPLVSAEHRNSVTAYVQRGLQEGARLRCGGDWGADEYATGFYYSPTVLDRCRRGMSVVTEESFGPVITVETFKSEQEALDIANDTEFGLAGAVWTSDQGKAHRMSRLLRHGTIWINDYHPYLPQAEWGGFKRSGIGRELGHSGLDEYREAKHIYQNTEPVVTGWFAQPS
ncbi:aldehyde dehydrogenase family protein [Glutamicibacter sp. JL.03c]|uniref:aldehyde dehydrogenase family protein n=1 Tax=Glutamicibacter sp. JL.03c TaxID=2984842 RepID=UPI0021F7D8F7|nr:aldehyde dehydrogenase family protein [Glutamicibacter sp. JL.03c]UYQ78872.1 aldehyde dehydrogenase family protein [Glutamicibacter sp. JL.03c]